MEAPVVVDKACFGAGNSNQEMAMSAGPILESQSAHMRWTEKVRSLDYMPVLGIFP